MDNWVLPVAAGLVAGVMNAAAGGGSFVSFPALIYAGVPPISANASSTVALFPGGLASAWELKTYISPFPRVSLRALIAPTFLGGCVGAYLLLHTSPAGFEAIVPWLLLTGTLTFAFGRSLGNLLRRGFTIGPAALVCAQFLLGVYGGYFGGAVGIMMMATWSIFGFTDIRIVNANKTLLVAIANTVAVVLFIVAGKVFWPQTLGMMAAAIVGGLLGAHYVKKIDPIRLRQCIVLLNFVITAIFFYRTFA